MLEKLQNFITMISKVFNFHHLIPLPLWVAAVLGTTVVSGFIFFLYRHYSQRALQNWPIAWLKFTFDIIKFPLVVLLGTYLIYGTMDFFTPSLVDEQVFAPYVLNIIEFITFFWLIFNILVLGKTRVLHWSFIVDNRLLNVLIPTIINTLQVALFLLMLNLFIPLINLSGIYGLYINKFSKVLFISALGVLFIQIINALEKIIVQQYMAKDETTNFAGRKIKTQVLLLKRIIVAIGIVVTVAAIFLVFDSVKNIGTGLLTTAGILSAVGVFASQQSISRIYAGLQIAFTQPIRMGDTVIIDNQLGQVEEITLSYVVIKLWDLRRLLIPTDHITSKGLQNLTRETTQLLGTIFFYTDYTLPVEDIRKQFFEFLKVSPYWDSKIWTLEVTDIKESTMEIRALVSAENSSTLWKLRCEIRENLMRYIVKHYPQCLAKSRTVTANIPFKGGDEPLFTSSM